MHEDEILGSLTVGATVGVVVFTALHAVFMVFHVMVGRFALKLVFIQDFSRLL